MGYNEIRHQERLAGLKRCLPTGIRSHGGNQDVAPRGNDLTTELVRDFRPFERRETKMTATNQGTRYGAESPGPPTESMSSVCGTRHDRTPA